MIHLLSPESYWPEIFRFSPTQQIASHRCQLLQKNLPISNVLTHFSLRFALGDTVYCFCHMQTSTHHHKVTQTSTHHHKATQTSTHHHKATQTRTHHHKATQTRTRHHKVTQNSVTALKVLCALRVHPFPSPTPGNHASFLSVYFWLHWGFVTLLGLLLAVASLVVSTGSRAHMLQ